MFGSCILLSMIFWAGRAVFINLIIAYYILTNYLTRPFVSIFYDNLSVEGLRLVESMDSFFNPDAAAVVYWSLFSLLLAWLLGLLILKPSEDDNFFSVPHLFCKIDEIVSNGGVSFYLTIITLYILNFIAPWSGLMSTVTGEGTPLFLWGMAQLSTIYVVCLFAFLKSYNNKAQPMQYHLLIPILLMFIGVFSGSRNAVFLIFVLSIIYYLSINYNIRWPLNSLFKFAVILLLFTPFLIFFGMVAQALRPLYMYSDSVTIADIIAVLDYEKLLMEKETLFLAITQLIHRLNAVMAQFYILNDLYVHNPLEYYNPIQSFMRIINDLVPGDVFPGILSINQLFDYIYFDNIVYYNSEMWGIQGTLYLYFGHFIAPFFVFIVALFFNRFYPTIRKVFIESPTFAAFLTLLSLDFITNGTAERVIPVDIIRPITSFVIFIFIYKFFNLVFSKKASHVYQTPHNISTGQQII